jgi:hypothetical protein
MIALKLGVCSGSSDGNRQDRDAKKHPAKQTPAALPHLRPPPSGARPDHSVAQANWRPHGPSFVVRPRPFKPWRALAGGGPPVQFGDRHDHPCVGRRARRHRSRVLPRGPCPATIKMVINRAVYPLTWQSIDLPDRSPATRANVQSESSGTRRAQAGPGPELQSLNRVSSRSAADSGRIQG